MKPEKSEDVARIESRLESLADEIAEAIGKGDAADRESLHDYAVSLVRERMPVAAELSEDRPRIVDEEGPSPRADLEAGKGGVQALGFGVLLVPVGFLLAWIFPPVGLLLMTAGVAMVVWGMAAAVLGRFLGRAESEAADEAPADDE